MKVGVLSDIHGNKAALEQVLIVAKQLEVEKLLILGDIVGYYYHPDMILKMLEDWDFEFIKGNHEEIISELAQGSMSFIDVKSKFGSGHKIALDKLSKKQIDFLITAPLKKLIKIDEVKFLMCHGSNWDSNLYLYPDSPIELLERCNEPDVDFVLIGHSHYPFAYRNQDSTLINVGSVGQSRTMGGIATWLIINTSNKSFQSMQTQYDASIMIEEVKKNDPEIPYLYEILRRGNQ